MLILQVFTEIILLFLFINIYNLAGFYSNVNEIEDKTHAKFSKFPRAKTQFLLIQKLQFDVNKYSAASVQVRQTIS